MVRYFGDQDSAVPVLRERVLAQEESIQPLAPSEDEIDDVFGRALTVALALRMSAASSGVANKGPRNGPGCDPSRSAVAHRLGGQRLARQPAHRPIPCLTVVGQTSESATVGVTRSGAVLYAPLLQNSAAPPTNVLQGPEFVVRSNDRGATWATLDSDGPTTGGLVPPGMSVDPHTSRIWFATTLPSLCGARISWSDDDGDHWRTSPSVDCPAQGAESSWKGRHPPLARGAPGACRADEATTPKRLPMTRCWPAMSRTTSRPLRWLDLARCVCAHQQPCIRVSFSLRARLRARDRPLPGAA